MNLIAYLDPGSGSMIAQLWPAAGGSRDRNTGRVTRFLRLRKSEDESKVESAG